MGQYSLGVFFLIYCTIIIVPLMLTVRQKKIVLKIWFLKLLKSSLEFQRVSYVCHIYEYNIKQFILHILCGFHTEYFHSIIRICVIFPLHCGTLLILGKILYIVESFPEPASQCRRCKEMWVQSLGQEDLLEEGTAAQSSIVVWRIP